MLGIFQLNLTVDYIQLANWSLSGHNLFYLFVCLDWRDLDKTILFEWGTIGDVDAAWLQERVASLVWSRPLAEDVLFVIKTGVLRGREYEVLIILVLVLFVQYQWAQGWELLRCLKESLCRKDMA